MLRSSDPTVSTRWRWRSPASPVAVARARPARPDSASRRADFDVIVATTRLMSRRSAHRATPASTMVTRMRRPVVASQSWACSRVTARALRLSSLGNSGAAA